MIEFDSPSKDEFGGRARPHNKSSKGQRNSVWENEGEFNNIGKIDDVKSLIDSKKDPRMVCNFTQPCFLKKKDVVETLKRLEKMKDKTGIYVFKFSMDPTSTTKGDIKDIHKKDAIHVVINIYKNKEVLNRHYYLAYHSSCKVEDFILCNKILNYICYKYKDDPNVSTKLIAISEIEKSEKFETIAQRSRQKREKRWSNIFNKPNKQPAGEKRNEVFFQQMALTDTITRKKTLKSDQCEQSIDMQKSVRSETNDRNLNAMFMSEEIFRNSAYISALVISERNDSRNLPASSWVDAQQQTDQSLSTTVTSIDSGSERRCNVVTDSVETSSKESTGPLQDDADQAMCPKSSKDKSSINKDKTSSNEKGKEEKKQRNKKEKEDKSGVKKNGKMKKTLVINDSKHDSNPSERSTDEVEAMKTATEGGAPSSNTVNGSETARTKNELSKHRQKPKTMKGWIVDLGKWIGGAVDILLNKSLKQAQLNNSVQATGIQGSGLIRSPTRGMV